MQVLILYQNSIKPGIWIDQIWSNYMARTQLLGNAKPVVDLPRSGSTQVTHQGNCLRSTLQRSEWKNMMRIEDIEVQLKERETTVSRTLVCEPEKLFNHCLLDLSFWGISIRKNSKESWKVLGLADHYTLDGRGPRAAWVHWESMTTERHWAQNVPGWFTERRLNGDVKA